MTTSVDGTCKHPIETSLKSGGDPKGLNRQPWSIVWLKTSAPCSRSTLPGVPKSGSAKWMFDECFHLQMNETRWNSKWAVTLGSIIASTAKVFPRWLYMSRCSIPHEESWVCKVSVMSLYLLVLALALSFPARFKWIHRDTHFNTSIAKFQHESDHVIR